jgi:hypothetical protein
LEEAHPAYLNPFRLVVEVELHSEEEEEAQHLQGVEVELELF